MSTLSPKSKLTISVILHGLVWGAWFASPIVFPFNNPQRQEPPKEISFYLFIWFPMLFSLALFYLNYFLFVEKLLFNKKILWFFGVNIILVILFSFTVDWIRTVSMSMAPMQEHSMPMKEPLVAMNKHEFKPPKNALFGLDNLIFILSLA